MARKPLQLREASSSTCADRALIEGCPVVSLPSNEMSSFEFKVFIPVFLPNDGASDDIVIQIGSSSQSLLRCLQDEVKVEDVFPTIDFCFWVFENLIDFVINWHDEWIFIQSSNQGQAQVERMR